jgi:hypothetical protein
MVRSILEGRKTQSRRVIQTPSGFCFGAEQQILKVRGLIPLPCPYGVPGDQLWVRETFNVGWLDGGKVLYRADGGSAKDAGYPHEPTWRPSIFMPRACSRITLELTEVRVQRLQEISEEDALAEGTGDWAMESNAIITSVTMRNAFSKLWDFINKKRGFGWDVNPWVWALTFRRLEAQHATAQ